MPENNYVRGSSGPAETATRINGYLERAMPLLTPFGVALGALLPSVFIVLRPLIPWFFASITLAGSLKLRARELGKAASSPLPIFFFFSAAHIIMPVIVLFISRFFFPDDPDTVSGYVLVYSVPTAVTGFIWVSIFRGDAALSLALILLDSILAPLVVPGTIRLLLGTSITLDMNGMMVSLILMVVIPTVMGVALNETSRGKIPAVVIPWLSPFSKICLVLMIASNAATVSGQIRPDNPKMWILMIGCVCFSALSFTIGKLIGLAARFEKEKQVTIFFASGLRNISAAMTLAIEFFPASAALPAILGIMFQQMIAAFMGRIQLGRND